MNTDQSASLADAPISSSSIASQRRWLAVFSIALGSFAFVTTEYLPVGVLPKIAADLGVTPGTAGLMTTTPGLIAAISAPMLLLAAGRLNRRSILLLLSVALVASNLIAALASTFTTMLVGRALLGISLGGFWTVALGVSGQIVAEEEIAKASATIFMGITLATVIGVPLGTFIAELASWRVSFFATAALALAALLMQATLLPDLPPRAAARIADFGRMLARGTVLRSLVLVALLFGAHFCAYTYIAPFLEDNASLGATWVTALLLGFGIVGFMSNFVASAFVTSHPRLSLFAMTALVMASLVALPAFAHMHGAVVAGVLAWGIAYGAIPLCLSMWMQMTSPKQPEAASALFVSAVQTAIAAGSLAGGVTVDHAGATGAMHLGVLLSALGLAVLASFATTRRTLASVLEG
ncbi:MFS transporter [Paraburkholderia caribensis]|uniref:MFS transporter n=1 Tax=Paraburkholderia caribensis TaxID=75105 RepID=A0A9Q6SA37_9BURK|nr:MFS transporter [Paraburkholderia caribensis]MCO4882442.1 MFS transporter [Paraburkholderia caribensis]PTB24202.1 MFS transporter [Paraburkholderia caribensis]QLB67251.1 MFS transporter [Paraburkholderia caribensis]